MAYEAELARIAAAPRTIVGPRTTVEGEVVKRDPSELAHLAGVPLDVYALGRLASSEWGSGPPAGLLAICEIGRNHAHAQGRSVARMLVADNDPGDAGYFGRQSGRWASTALDPTRRTIVAAEVALGGSRIVGDCERFYDPRSQDGGRQAGQQLRHDAVAIVSKWGAEGWEFSPEEEVYRHGVDPDHLMVFRRARGHKVDTSSAMAAILAGRHGSHGPVAGVLALLGVGALAVKLLGLV